MPDDVFVGLMVASGDAWTAASARFAGVVVRAPGAQNEPPAVSILRPADGERFQAGAAIALAASAADHGGAIARVDFYRGTTLLGTDTTAPYSAMWKGAPAGAHLLSVVARDTDGAVASTSATIFVGTAEPSPGSTLSFTAAADHEKNVGGYTLAIFHANDQVSATPIVEASLGKPAPVDGEISVDISSLLDALQPGSYKAVVAAIGPGGSTASAPSPTFVR
jgi:hypothetical protein